MSLSEPPFIHGEVCLEVTPQCVAPKILKLFLVVRFYKSLFLFLLLWSVPCGKKNHRRMCFVIRCIYLFIHICCYWCFLTVFCICIPLMHDGQWMRVLLLKLTYLVFCRWSFPECLVRSEVSVLSISSALLSWMASSPKKTKKRSLSSRGSCKSSCDVMFWSDVLLLLRRWKKKIRNDYWSS